MIKKAGKIYTRILPCIFKTKKDVYALDVTYTFKTKQEAEIFKYQNFDWEEKN